MPSTKNPLLRHRIIDKCLREHPFSDKTSLRRACQEAMHLQEDRGERISDSTIEKDIITMRHEYDAPILYDRLKKGYYYADPDFSISELPLSEAEVNAIRFAANTLLQFKDTDLFGEIGNTIDKIVDRISMSMHTKPKALQQHVQFETSSSTGGGQYLLLLLTAIQNSSVVYFDYENFLKKTVKLRKVGPLLLKEYRNRWYLISFDLVKEAITTYALERMSKIEVAQETFSKPSDFDPQEFFRYSVGISTKETIPEVVKFVARKTASKYLNTQPFHSSQKAVAESDEDTTYELSAFVSEELIREILSYGGEITVIEPISLREIIEGRLTEMAKNYGLKF